MMHKKTPNRVSLNWNNSQRQAKYAVMLLLNDNYKSMIYSYVLSLFVEGYLHKLFVSWAKSSASRRTGRIHNFGKALLQTVLFTKHIAALSFC